MSKNNYVEKIKEDLRLKLNVASGPLSWVGGVKTHILNIKKFSSHNIFTINYSRLSLYFPKYKGVGFFILRNQLPLIDPYGLYLSKCKLSQYDIVHTHGHVYWQDIYRLPKKSKAKYIHTVHQIYFKEESLSDKQWKVMDIQNNLMFNYCRNQNVTTVTVSEYVKNILLENGIGAEIIPNGVDFDEIGNSNAERFRRDYNITDDFYLFVGHMGFIKRPDLFIELAKKMPERKFVMIGPDVSEKNIKLKYKLLIPENLIIIGKIPRYSVLDALKACKVYLLTSIRESFSITLLESFACKRPAVAMNSGGTPELKKAGVPIILSEPNDFEDLFEKANYAWDHPELGEEGSRVVKEKYDWKIVIKSIDGLYERVIGL